MERLLLQMGPTPPSPALMKEEELLSLTRIRVKWEPPSPLLWVKDKPASPPRNGSLYIGCRMKEELASP